MDDSCKNVQGSEVVATSVRESNSVDKDREKGNPGECPDSHGTYLHSLPILELQRPQRKFRCQVWQLA